MISGHVPFSMSYMLHLKHYDKSHFYKPRTYNLATCSVNLENYIALYGYKLLLRTDERALPVYGAECLREGRRTVRIQTDAGALANVAFDMK